MNWPCVGELLYGGDDGDGYHHQSKMSARRDR